jgi:hypothetical protein
LKTKAITISFPTSLLVELFRHTTEHIIKQGQQDVLDKLINAFSNDQRIFPHSIISPWKYDFIRFYPR